MTDGQNMASDHYDAIVIGSGQGGGPLSTALVGAGCRTALIEREYIGGTCINTGCSPTKTMVASARVAYLARRGAEYGVKGTVEAVDLGVVRARKRQIVESFRTGSEQAIAAGGVHIIRGAARFTGTRSIHVDLTAGGRRALTADRFFIDTGSRPADPPVSGLDVVPHYDSTTIMELADVPEHLVILGGGYIAVEFGQMFRRFGSRVTLVERGGQLLAREDHDIADALRLIFEDDGIEVLLHAATEGAEPITEGVRLLVRVDGGVRSIEGSHLLVATGRKLNTDALDLPAAGVQCNEHGVITVNERLETTAAGIYALGEAAGTPAFTHMSYDDFRVLRANLIEHGNRTTAGRMVPYTVFTDPQLGRVGMTEADARQSERRIGIATLPMTGVARALEMGETRGVVKAVVDMDTEEILGAAALGIEGGEIMAMFELAMIGKLRYSALRDGIFAHPTLAELLNNLFSRVE